MKRINVFVIIAPLIIILAGCNINDNSLKVNGPVQDKTFALKNASLNGKYIVVFKTDAGISLSDLQTRNEKVKAKAVDLLKKYEISGDIEEIYTTALQGFTVKMAPGQIKKLAYDDNIKMIEADCVVELSPIEAMVKTGSRVPPPQSIPWGIVRVGGPQNGIGKTAWIIDTGIEFDHPDLNVDIERSATFLGPKTTPNDENGHGTHVAGIIGAKDNEIGVVGVAAGASLVSVRVLDNQARGTVSGVIAGIDYVAENANKKDVANISLGGGISQAFDEAVLGAAKTVPFALAAGNRADDADNYSPGRVDDKNIYTVSAMDRNDNWAYFSNFGPSVDYCAPGVAIYSTYKNGKFATLSGTSQAAPHVAGLLLLGSLNSDGTVNGDPDGEGDPIAHR